MARSLGRDRPMPATDPRQPKGYAGHLPALDAAPRVGGWGMPLVRGVAKTCWYGRASQPAMMTSIEQWDVVPHVPKGGWRLDRRC